MGLSYRPGLAQQSGPISPADSSGVTIRLEPHEKQTHFELGDPIALDLVLTAKSSGYAVFMDSNGFNAPQDLVNVTPTDGWFRPRGHQYGGSPEDLGQGPVRIPVMLNRSIVFQRPGHYEITITTRRLLPSRTGAPGGAVAQSIGARPQTPSGSTSCRATSMKKAYWSPNFRVFLRRSRRPSSPMSGRNSMSHC